MPADLESFFATCAGVAGALIGLLFVALSVAADRLRRAEAANQVSRIRVNSALIAFTNTLSVSLFALLPGEKIGYTAAIVAFIGLTFLAGALLSLVRVRYKRFAVRDFVFFAGLAGVFVLQLISGIQVIQRPGFSDGAETIATLVIACFLIGIGRAWELIGGPSIGFGHEVALMVRGEPSGAERASDADSGAGAGGHNPPASS